MKTIKSSRVFQQLKVFCLFLLVVTLMLSFTSCVETVNFSGEVLELTERGIPNSIVEVNGVQTKTNEQGAFTLDVPKTNRYVLNISKEGYGFVSKIFEYPAVKRKYKMARASLTQANADKEIIAKDEMNRDASRKWVTNDSNPLASIPFVYNQKGTLVDLELPESLQKAYDLYFNTSFVNTGSSVVIPPGAIVAPGGSQAKGQVNVYVTTVDLYSADGMPGDNTVADPQAAAYMDSFGASSIEIYQGGQQLELNPDMNASITIPIDPVVLRSGEPAPDSIPFLYYMKGTGEWQQDGWARLNSSRNAYTATTSHFSSFNMDLVKTNPSCIAFRAMDDVPESKMNLKVIAPRTTGAPKSLDFVLDESTSNCNPVNGKDIHWSYNLPNNSPIGYILFDATTNFPLRQFVFFTEGVDYTNQATKPTCPYAACAGSPFLLTSANTTATPLIVGKSVTTGTAIVSWVFLFANVADLANKYVLQGKKNSDTTWTDLKTITSPAAIMYHRENLNAPFAPGEQWDFRVMATDAGTDKPSNVVTIDIAV